MSNATRSLTLDQLETLPETACVNCPNTVWHLVFKEEKKNSKEGPKENLRVFCLLMHALIDERLTLCDGTMIFPQQK